MRGQLRRHFLTLVLFLLSSQGLATPTENVDKPQPYVPINKTEKPPANAEELNEYNLLESPPDPKDKSQQGYPYFFPYRQSLTPRFGIQNSAEDNPTWTYLVGISYLWPRYASPQAEIGADVVVGIGGHLHFSVRHILYDRNFFRPYFSWGATHEVIPDDGMATFTNFDNYYARGSVGFENVVKLPRSVRVELEALVGLKKYMLVLSYGYSWAW